MSTKELISNIYCVGSKDRHRPFFDNLMPLEEGTSYNAFLIKGSEKTALVDTVYPPCHSELIDKLKEMGIEKIDYVIINHGEQDHTGTLPELLSLFPEAKIVTNKKCQEITMGFLPLKEDQYHIVADGDEISLGDKTLQFMFAPWVHWPDTMFAFLKEDKILFSTDFFGAHVTNYDVFWDGTDTILPLIKAYYAEIQMPFAKIWAKYLDKIAALNPSVIAPSHGPAYKGDGVRYIMDLYRKWSAGPRANKVVIVGVSMYGSTTLMIDYLKKALEEKGIEVKHHDVMNLNNTELASDLIDCKGVIVASPTVLTGLHPMVVEPVFLLNAIKPNIQFLGLIGSYSWGTLIVNSLTGLLGNMKTVPFLDPVLAKGTPKEADYAALDKLADTIKQNY